MKRFLVLLIALGFLIAGCAQQQPIVEPTVNNTTAVKQKTETKPTVKVETIKLGYVGPLTGDMSDLGSEVKNAMMLAVKEINSKGGIDGKKFEIIIEDGRCTQADATAAAQSLLSKNVTIIIGAVCEEEVAGIASAINGTTAILLTVSRGEPSVNNTTNVFRAVPAETASAEKLADYIVMKAGKKRTYIVMEPTTYGKGYAARLTNAMKALGVSPAYTDTISNLNDSSIIAIRAKRLNTDSRVIITEDMNKAAAIITQMKMLDENGAYFTGEREISQQFLNAVGNDADGVMGVLPYINIDSADASEFLNGYAIEYGRGPQNNYITLRTRDMVFMVSDAIEEKNSANGIEVAEYLYNKKGWSGISPLEFDTNGNVANPQFILYRMEGAAIKPFYDFTSQ